MWERFKDWIIKKLGGYTKEDMEYEHEKADAFKSGLLVKIDHLKGLVKQLEDGIAQETPNQMIDCRVIRTEDFYKVDVESRWEVFGDYSEETEKSITPYLISRMASSDVLQQYVKIIHIINPMTQTVEFVARLPIAVERK